MYVTLYVYAELHWYTETIIVFLELHVIITRGDPVAEVRENPDTLGSQRFQDMPFWNAHTAVAIILKRDQLYVQICNVCISIYIKNITEISPILHLCCFPNPDSCTQAFPLGRRTCDLYLLPVPTAVASWWAAVSAHASVKNGLCFQLLCQGFDDTNIDGSIFVEQKWKYM